MAPLMEFYGGLTPDGFWRLRIDELKGLLEYRNRTVERLNRR